LVAEIALLLGEGSSPTPGKIVRNGLTQPLCDWFTRIVYPGLPKPATLSF